MQSSRWIIIACLVSSFLGGMAASAVLHLPGKAFAQEKKDEKVLKAQRFEIVDDKSAVVGSLGTDGEHVVLKLGKGTPHLRLTEDSFVLGNGTRNWVMIANDKDTGMYRIKISENGNVVWKQP